MDFSNPERVREIVNSFVEGVTNGHIRDLLPPGSVPSNGNMVLANAAFFKGNWAKAFLEHLTTNKTFNGPTPTVVEMMNVEGRFYHGTDNILFLSFPSYSRFISYSI